jgi:mannose-6-phosphate isomerase-like protein (cupin superfamily)
MTGSTGDTEGNAGDGVRTDPATEPEPLKRGYAHLDESPAWEAPEPNRRTMGVMFERDITPTSNLAAGFVRIPPRGEQPRYSRHPGEEIYFVVRGRGIFDREGHRDTVPARGAVYVRPFDPHRWINDSDEELELLFVNAPSAFGRVEGYLDTVAGWHQVNTFPGDDGGTVSEDRERVDR